MTSQPQANYFKSIMKPTYKLSLGKIMTTVTETFGVSRAFASGVMVFVALFALGVGFWFFYSAPPTTLTITSGPVGSVFYANAVKYAKILARNKVTLKILTSQGSLENLKRLGNPTYQVDIGFVQGGITNDADIRQLVSLGSVFYEPLLVFYRSPVPINLLSQLNGKRIAIGFEGSGTHMLALTLLAANGIQPGGATDLLDFEGEVAAQALIGNKADAAFLMGDSASPQVMRQLLHTPGIQLFSFIQADGYTRRISYLNKLELPQGCLDFGKNLPAQDVQLLGPTVELIARSSLHPTLSDLLLEAAREVHGTPTVLQRRGEFPAPLEHDFHLSADAHRFYTSGKSFLYRSLPFWLASLSNRILVVFVPRVVVLIPGLRLIPALYKWRIRLGIYRRYRALLALEKELFAQDANQRQKEFATRLNQIEEAVNKMKVPASFADQFYGLRGHISFVRGRLHNSNQ